MTIISVLGTGAMGSRMTANLLKAGHQVTVWNRTPEATAPLVALGATLAPTPRDAAQGAEIVMAMVRDDDASRQVWLDPEIGALAGMSAGTIALESSTVTAGWIRELGAATAAHEVALLEAPVSGSTPQAESAQLVYLIGGDAEILQRAEPVLRAMGSSIQHVGPLGTGALTKLTTNALMGIQVAALAELIGMLRRNGTDTEQVLAAVGQTPVWSTILDRNVGLLLNGALDPRFPVALIEKDFGYTIDATGADDLAPTIAAARAVFQRAIDAGLGEANMTSVVRLFTDTPID